MDLSKCEEKIVKADKNHAVVQKILYEKDGKQVIVDTEEYGQPKIDQELALVNAKINQFSDPEYIASQLAEANGKKARLNAIQAELNK